jgi:hypothetical protein
MRDERATIMLTGVGKRCFAALTKTIAVDPNPLAPAQYAAQVRLAPPRIDDPAYVPFLQELCEQHSVGAVLPLTDLDIEVLARAREQGLLPAMTPSSEVARATRGALLEGWIHTLLLTYMAQRDLAQEIAYWSPAGSRHTEVDFLLSRGSEHCALEIRAAGRVQPQHLTGLRAIASLAGLKRRVLVHQGDRPGRTEDRIDLWPLASLLDALQTDRLWA